MALVTVGVEDQQVPDLWQGAAEARFQRLVACCCRPVLPAAPFLQCDAHLVEQDVNAVQRAPDMFREHAIVLLDVSQVEGVGFLAAEILVERKDAGEHEHCKTSDNQRGGSGKSFLGHGDDGGMWLQG